MNELTPLMVQYFSIKQNYKNEILFFRLGDFYEMFDSDAKEVSRLLNLTLTRRGSTPMCGVPYHAAKIYIARLLRMGKKIAICEQVGEAKTKGLTERKVVEVITPGNVTDEEYLEGAVNNFLASVCLVKTDESENGKRKDTIVSYSYIDVSTGNFYATHWSFENFSEFFQKELGRSLPKEIIVSQTLADYKEFDSIVALFSNMSISVYPDWHFTLELGASNLKKQFGAVTLRSFSITEKSPEVASSGFLLEYIVKNTGMSKKSVLPHITNLKVYSDSEFLVIDDSSRRNLEITSNLHDGSKNYSLIETVSNTKTPMGRRLLFNWFMYPLTDKEQIISRQNHIKNFYENPLGLNKIREILSKIYDIERLAARVALEKAHPKDLQTLKVSLLNSSDIQNILQDIEFPVIENENASFIAKMIDDALIEDPPTNINEGGYIKKGYSEELDNLRNIHENFSTILNTYLEEEKETTGIQNLKIRYNNMIGYYIEVSKGKLSNVPEHFILRRALVNGDRYTTKRLQELENELVTANEKILILEKNIYFSLIAKIAEYLNYLLQLSHVISYVDVGSSFAYSALTQNWVRPEITDDNSFIVKNGRHPVVEFHINQGDFVPNDVDLSDKNFALITGPNMAGKSTFLRQNALIALLAQVGSYVPAESARLGIVDKIFCRVGASDNLARGESTFLVEMSETALILRSATEKSLVIMDEVGRGTSTEDGLSLAWAISEYLLHSIRSKTLFATHYHQLTRMNHLSLQKLCMDVFDSEGKIIFLRKVIKGCAQNSYGLHVARIAGVPAKIIERAQEILDSFSKSTNLYTDGLYFFDDENDIEKLENSENIDDIEEVENSADMCKSKKIPKSVNFSSPGLFSEEEIVLDSILSVDVNSMTPLEALAKISEWKRALTSM
ncbi:MAG: DNA mismatch repair protein MutS [Treponemataceae bacterium]